MYLQFAGAVLLAVKLGKDITSTQAEAEGGTRFENCSNQFLFPCAVARKHFLHKIVLQKPA